MADTSQPVDSLNSSDSTTLYLVLVLQVLLVIERVFSNVFKRIKRCKCSQCCSVDMLGASGDSSVNSDSPNVVRRSREIKKETDEEAKKESSSYD
jgi:hypothetical protein